MQELGLIVAAARELAALAGSRWPWSRGTMD